MFEDQRIGALLLMAGSGFRFGSEVPKQFHLLEGKEIFRYALDTMIASNFFEEIILVCHPEWMDVEDLPKIAKAVEGGRTRQESVFIGLKSFREKLDIVLIHDAVRPFVTEELLRLNILGAMEHGATDSCIQSTDTLVQSDGKSIFFIPNRNTFLRGQTPQTFTYDLIYKAHQMALRDGIQEASDDCQLILKYMGKAHKIHIVPGSESNLKITTEFDLKIAELYLNQLILLN